MVVRLSVRPKGSVLCVAKNQKVGNEQNATREFARRTMHFSESTRQVIETEIMQDPFIGATGPDYEVRIEWGAIRQFVRSLYSSLPAWYDTPDAVVPPTFLVTAGYHWGYILERPLPGSQFEAIGANTGPVMDGEQSFIFFGPPPRAGDILFASTTLIDHRFKSGRSGGRLEFFYMQTDFRTADGRLVARWLPTSIRTEFPAVQSFITNPDVPYIQRNARRRELDVIGPQAAGCGPGPVTMPALTLTDIIRYQCASGEDNATHHDLLCARAHGYPAPFSVGMHQAGVLAAYAAHWLGPQNVRKFRARFLDMVWQGDVLTYDGRIVTEGVSSEGPTVDVELTCARNGQPVVRAWATFLNSASGPA
jgi:hypothetical protein